MCENLYTYRKSNTHSVRIFFEKIRPIGQKVLMKIAVHVKKINIYSDLIFFERRLSV